ncbi:hypothetical protein [Burkholderia cepacia]|uniref:hypothetical protein n=1 Tax=Burkholderia cepacia TaxID=292 RepID=UPI002FE30237
MKMNIREAQPNDLDSIRKLLEENQLPIADVTAPLLDDFLVAVGPGLVGVVGLERFGSNALLRSLVVAGDGRSRGLGQELVSYRRAEAVRNACVIRADQGDRFLQLDRKRSNNDALCKNRCILRGV